MFIILTPIAKILLYFFVGKMLYQNCMLDSISFREIGLDLYQFFFGGLDLDPCYPKIDREPGSVEKSNRSSAMVILCDTHL